MIARSPPKPTPRAKRVLSSSRSELRVLLVAPGTGTPERRFVLVPSVAIGNARNRYIID